MTAQHVELKVALLRRGLTARQMAARLQISEWTFSRILNGHQDAGSDLMERMRRELAEPVVGPNDLALPPSHVWVTVQTEWYFEGAHARHYAVSSNNPLMHGIALELRDGKPFNVLGYHMPPDGDYRARMLDVGPVEHLLATHAPATDEAKVTALHPGHALRFDSATDASGDRPILAVETVWSSASRYLVISGGAIRWEYPAAMKVVEVEK